MPNDYITDFTKAIADYRLAVASGDKSATTKARNRVTKEYLTADMQHRSFGGRELTGDEIKREAKLFVHRLSDGSTAQSNSTLKTHTPKQVAEHFNAGDVYADAVQYGTKADERAARKELREKFVVYDGRTGEGYHRSGYDHADIPATKKERQEAIQKTIDDVEGFVKERKRDQVRYTYFDPGSDAFKVSRFKGKTPSSVKTGSPDLDGDGKVEKDEKELVSAKSAVSAANTKRLNLDISPDNPDLRDAHGHYLSKSEDLAEAVAEYKDNRDKTRLSKSEKKAVSAAAGVSDKRPSTSRRGGRGRLK